MQPYSSAKLVSLLDKHHSDTVEDKLLWFSNFSSSDLQLMMPSFFNISEITVNMEKCEEEII